MTMRAIRDRIAVLRSEKADIEQAIGALEELGRLRLARGVLSPTTAVLEIQRAERVWRDPPAAA